MIQRTLSHKSSFFIQRQFPHWIDSCCILKASYKAHLVILEPGQALCGQHEPVLLRSSLHDADVIDGQPALPDHLTIKADASQTHTTFRNTLITAVMQERMKDRRNQQWETLTVIQSDQWYRTSIWMISLLKPSLNKYSLIYLPPVVCGTKKHLYSINTVLYIEYRDWFETH